MDKKGVRTQTELVSDDRSKRRKVDTQAGEQSWLCRCLSLVFDSRRPHLLDFSAVSGLRGFNWIAAKWALVFGYEIPLGRV